MINENIQKPDLLNKLEKELRDLDFNLSCDLFTGSILRTIASSKPSAKILELGTGAGISTSWILEGMDSASKLITIEKEDSFQAIAKKILGFDKRVTFITMDGGEYIKNNKDEKFDFIFADTWPGKFYLLDEVLNMLSKGGVYLIDDLTLVSTWPEEHILKVKQLIKYLESRNDLILTKLKWSTGLIIATKRP